MRETCKWAAAVAVVAMVTAACGDDDGEASRPTTASFCAELDGLEQGDEDEGPFTEFYTKHPEPTPADWAADGHLVTDALQKAIDGVSAVDPSEEAEPYVADVLAALETMRQNSLDVSAAGADSDQSALDELERVNQDTNVPNLTTAMQAVG